MSAELLHSVDIVGVKRNYARVMEALHRRIKS